MTTASELAGVEKLVALGFAEAQLSDAREVFAAMLEVALNEGEIALPRLENCVSYAARDNAGFWHNLDQSNQWVRYDGPGRVPQPTE